MKRVRLAIVAAVAAAAVVGGISQATPKHDAHCAALHARATEFQKAANQTSDPKLKARYQNRADSLEAQADKCDARGTTTTQATTSTTAP
jgi:uncharacterized membrane protein YccC